VLGPLYTGTCVNNTVAPTTQPTISPIYIKTLMPSAPSTTLSILPSSSPSSVPSTIFSCVPSCAPSRAFSLIPTTAPNIIPSILPSVSVLTHIECSNWSWTARDMVPSSTGVVSRQYVSAASSSDGSKLVTGVQSVYYLIFLF
jgi:hypothetical protein